MDIEGTLSSWHQAAHTRSDCDNTCHDWCQRGANNAGHQQTLGGLRGGVGRSILAALMLLATMLEPATAATGIITTVAGNSPGGFSSDGGPATSALLSSAQGVALDAGGNLFIADTSNHRIRRVDAGTGIITTVAGTGLKGLSGDGGPATSAALNTPSAVALDSHGNLFIVDFNIRC